MSHAHGTDSEIATLRTVLVHRPGPELRRLSPRRGGGLLLDAIPWVSRARDPAARPEAAARAPAAVPRPAATFRAAVTAPDLIVDPLAAEAPALTELTESRLPGAVVTLHPSTGRLAAL